MAMGNVELKGDDRAAAEAADAAVLTKFSAQIGELAQHHLITDPGIKETGDWYYRLLSAVIDRAPEAASRQPPRYLEVGCWQHIVGYRLGHERGFEPTLFDICDRDLERGRDAAIEAGFGDTCDRVVGDFHDLPFADGYFDVAMISAAIHHTRDPERIVGELLRVVADGGIFYCQREPAERLFCFYRFAANRPSDYTPFEAHLHARDVMRLFSSPFPGARNAELFDRVENDRIGLDRYYAIFERYGTVKEQVLYCDGLLTAMDKTILANDGLDQPALASLIEDLVMAELELAMPLFGERERLLGYSLPTAAEVRTKARDVAAALKARPEDRSSVAWQQAMVRIFGGSLRFVVRRDSGRDLRSAVKFRRPCTPGALVRYDDVVYKHSGLRFWDKLLPDLQGADEQSIRDAAFPASDWRIQPAPNGTRSLVCLSYSPMAVVEVATRAVLVMRLRVVVDERLPAARLEVSCAGNDPVRATIAQTEDRMLRFVLAPGRTAIRFSMHDLEDGPVSAASRIRVSILQAIPIAD